MNNDSMRHDVREVMALAREQMRAIADAQQRRTALSATGTAADKLVAVTVNAHGMVTSVVIEESYLQEFEFTELGAHITTAAQAAAQEVEQRGTAIFAPLMQRRQELSALSGRVANLPELSELMSLVNPAAAAVQHPQHDGDGAGDWTEDPRYPTVRT
jgi:DNA-binding protein YbaB